MALLSESVSLWSSWKPRPGIIYSPCGPKYEESYGYTAEDPLRKIRAPRLNGVHSKLVGSAVLDYWNEKPPSDQSATALRPLLADIFAPIVADVKHMKKQAKLQKKESALQKKESELQKKQIVRLIQSHLEQRFKMAIADLKRITRSKENVQELRQLITSRNTDAHSLALPKFRGEIDPAIQQIAFVRKQLCDENAFDDPEMEQDHYMKLLATLSTRSQEIVRNWSRQAVSLITKRVGTILFLSSSEGKSTTKPKFPKLFKAPYSEEAERNRRQLDAELKHEFRKRGVDRVTKLFQEIHACADCNSLIQSALDNHNEARQDAGNEDDERDVAEAKSRGTDREAADNSDIGGASPSVSNLVDLAFCFPLSFHGGVCFPLAAFAQRARQFLEPRASKKRKTSSTTGPAEVKRARRQSPSNPSAAELPFNDPSPTELAGASEALPMPRQEGQGSRRHRRKRNRRGHGSRATQF